MVPYSFALISEMRPLTPREVITYRGLRPGWESDPGAEAVFVTDDGWAGTLYAAGTWGGVADTILALANEEVAS